MKVVDVSSSEERSAKSAFLVVSILAFAKLMIHLLTNAFGSYGIFRDEFYYLACASRIDLGYVDQPPLSIYILALNRILIGDSLFALRLLPAIAGAATVFVAGLIVRRFGGGTFAIVIAGLSLIVSPIHLAMNTLYSMNCFDIFLWTLGMYVLILIVDENRPQHWLILGVIIGLGLLNKISMGWFAAGLLVALLTTRHRQALTTQWPYLAAIIAFLIFLPYVIWNIRHDFAFLEFIRNATSQKYSALTPVDFLLGQLMLVHPFTAPVWFLGLFYLFFDERGKKHRMCGIVFLTTMGILVANIHSKPEYLAAAYAVLFAAGGVQVEQFARRPRWRWVRYALPSLILLGGIATAPFTLPFLPVRSFIAYSERIGVKPESNESKELSELHQLYADMFGWEEMAATVSRVYASLSPEERAKSVFWGRNYGRAGAVEYYSRKYELPPVISSHNSYWIWGYGSGDYEVLIMTGGSREDLLTHFESVEQADTVRCIYCMPYENRLPVFVCRNPKSDPREAFARIWPEARHYE
ncbi:MAG: glycosyltransferase family 39 protein [Ignavibacteria bacterium]|nr:glycosyltransferase family 39 protein [Ignavibacteria bacterium]